MHVAEREPGASRHTRRTPRTTHNGCFASSSHLRSPPAFSQAIALHTRTTRPPKPPYTRRRYVIITAVRRRTLTHDEARVSHVRRVRVVYASRILLKVAEERMASVALATSGFQ